MTVSALSLAQHSQRSLSNNVVVSVVTALIGGVILPATIFFWPNLLVAFNLIESRTSLFAALFATTVSMLAVRRTTIFPGASEIGAILPAFLSMYGLAAVILLLVRQPYSIAIFAITFVSSVLTAFAIERFARRRPATCYHIVPGGRVECALEALRGDVVIMENPLTPADFHSVVIADLHFDHADEWERMLASAALRGIPVYHYKQIWEAVTGRVRIEHLSENSFGTLLPDLTYRKFKRLVDTAVAVALLPLLIIPFCVFAVLIKIDSTGPVLFRQSRIGYGRREFEVIKFRTMHDAEHRKEASNSRESSITKDDDKRITRLGKFLRRSRIDEVPQIINILKGEMSWIGPRPEAAPLSEWYEREVPFYAYRHIVRPGITGWAQINQGHVTGLDDIHAKLQYDFFYIKNFSCWIDLLIVVRTIVVMATGFGAK